MKWHLRTVLVLAATGCLLQGNLILGQKDTKEPAKKQESKDTVVPDEINQTDSKDKMFGQSYCKTYTFKMAQGKTYLFDVKSTTFLPHVRLEDGAGKTIMGDNPGGLAASVVHRSAKTQDYQIVVTSINRGMGKFTLTIKEIDAGDGKPIELKPAKGEAMYKGNLLATDPRYKANKIHKFFIVAMEAGKTYQIDHMSDKFDCYLYFEDPDGNLLAQDDDGGVGLNSRISHKVEKTGKYRIVATSLNGRGTGEFTLTVRQTDPPFKEEAKKK